MVLQPGFLLRFVCLFYEEENLQKQIGRMADLILSAQEQRLWAQEDNQPAILLAKQSRYVYATPLDRSSVGRFSRHTNIMLPLNQALGRCVYYQNRKPLRLRQQQYA